MCNKSNIFWRSRAGNKKCWLIRFFVNTLKGFLVVFDRAYRTVMRKKGAF